MKLGSPEEELKETMGEVPQSTKAKQRRLDQMLEAQMISDILRAHNNLRAFNTFRVSHEASHREKELAEARKKEIQEPLEAAVFENELLHGKVTRREEVICDLRRELLLENIRSKTATLCSREGGTRNQLPTASHPHIDVNQSDEYKINQMKDEIAELHLIIEHQDRELDTCRKAMSSQSKKIKELRDVAEQSEYTFQERIRKIDSDKDIYLGMIESRENKIEKLMEENDELNEQVNELNETVDKAKGAKVHAQKMMEEYKEKAVEAIKIKEEAEGKFNEYVEQIKVLREENFEYSEKISDLQTRYENLILELDRMVEEGYYIPDTTKTPKSTRTRRQNKIAKPQDLMKMASFKTPKKPKVTIAHPNAQGVGAVGGGVGSGEQEDDMPVQSNYSSYSNLSVTHTGSAVALPVSFTFSNLAINTNHSNQIEEEVGEDEEDEDDNSSTGNRPKSSESAYTNEDGTAPVTPRLGRFSMRKAQEDALLQEKLAAHAATRMKDVLEEKISELETQLHSEKNGRKQDYKHFQVAKESLQLEQRVLAAEVSRLTQKITDNEKTIAGLNEEVSIAQAAAKFSGLRQSELVTRLSQISIQKNRHKPSPTKEDTASNRDDSNVGTEAVEPKKKKERRTATTSSACGPDLEDYVHLDVLTYMHDWDNAQKYSKGTNTDELILRERETQYDEEDYLEPKTLDEYMVEQSSRPGTIIDDSQSLHSQKDEVRSNTSGKRSRIATPVSQYHVRVLREDPEVMHQFEKLYEGFVKVCVKYLPIQKRQLFMLSQEKSLIKQGLNPQDLLPNVDIDWQVKNTITLLVALNEMRNQFVYSYLDEERKDEHLMTGIDEAEFSNVKVVVTIRFIDLLIQVIHHLLSPLRHLESSDYPNLNALFEVISAPMITNVNGDLAEESDIHSRKLRDKTAMMMDDTFPLTEVTLTADPVHGAPRGILSLLDEFQRHKKIYRSQSPLSKPLDSSNNNSRSNSPSRQYMNRTSPRTLPLNIDEVLDMLERRSRSNSPEATHRPATDTLERHLAQGSVDSNDDARKYAFQLLEEVIKVDESVADDEGFISLALPQTEVIPFPVKLADQSISSVGSSKPPDFTNYNKFIKMYDKNRPADTDNDYLDYTRFVFNKDHIISNAYVKQTRRALSASSRERKVRIQGVGIVGSVDTNNDRTRQDFPRVHYCGSSSREGTSGVRPYSAHPPGPEIRPKQPTEYTPGLDTINSVASAGVEEAGSVTLNKMNDSSTLATGGSVVPRPPQGNKRSIVHRDMKVMQRAGVPSGSTSAPQSPHHIHRNVVPPAVKYSRSELPEGERAPSTNGAIELTGNNLLFGPQLGTQQGVRSQAILMNRDRGGAPTQSTKRPQSANRTRTIPNDSATQPPAARYYYAPTPTKTLFTATSDDKDNAVLNLKETQIGEYVSSHAKVVDPLSISRDLGGTASEQVTEIARQQAYRQGLLSVQGKKRTTSDGDYGGSSRERVTNAVLFM